MKTKTVDTMQAANEIAEKSSKKQSKREKKARKEKRKRKRNAKNETDGDRIGVDADSAENESEKDCFPTYQDDDNISSNNKKVENSDKKKKKKSKKKKKGEKKSKGINNDRDTESNDEKSGYDSAIQSTGDGRLVASSAIEFYDDDLKKRAKKRQKVTLSNKITTGDNAENDTGLEEALKKQRSKSKKKKRHRDDDKAEREKELKQRDELDKVLIPEKKHIHSLTLLLFYQYIEPEWDDETHEKMLRNLQKIGTTLELTGRMRCAKEGLNCTLTGTHSNILEYTKALRQLRPKEFCNTEFKLTTDLPLAQKFGELKVLPVKEIVRYGLDGEKAPPIQQYSGVHLEPKYYHKKLAESNTVIIDVRNHYEAAIGRFVPPTKDDSGAQTDTKATEGPKWIDPKMRKSTEFPAWLDKEETKEMMKGKQVLMYCTGGIRCERASALLQYKMETDESVKDLGIKGVFQLQGGIDKYFKEFPDGGYWKGKNYVFDKRFAHAPPKIDGELHGRVIDKDDENDSKLPANAHVMGKCEACHKPWDMYRGKRRCPTCGVPSLICKDCFLADKEGRKKLGKEVRCDLCVEQGIFSKRQYRENDERFIQDYESKMTAKGLLLPNAAAQDPEVDSAVMAPNPKGITRLVLKNMCRKKMTEDALMEALPGITHIVWNTQRNRKNPSAEPIFTGMGWVEMATPDDAARAVAKNNQLKVFGRTIGIAFQAPDGKDVWPAPNSRVV